MAAGDVSGPILTGVSGLATELTTVAVAGIGLGALVFGFKKAWATFRGTAKG